MEQFEEGEGVTYFDTVAEDLDLTVTTPTIQQRAIITPPHLCLIFSIDSKAQTQISESIQRHA